MAPTARAISARTQTHQLRARAARNEMNENISLGRIAGIHVGFNWSLLVIAALSPGAWQLGVQTNGRRPLAVYVVVRRINIRGRPDVEKADRLACSEKLLEFGDRDAVSTHVRLLHESR